MKQPIKKGTTPMKPNVQSKNELDMISLLKGDNSVLEVPKECKDELKSKNLAFRWIDILELGKNQGIHKKGWAPYKFDCKLPGSANPFGQHAGQYEGYLVRRQLVLGVLPQAEADLIKARNQLRTKMQSDPVKLKRDELQQMARQHGVSSKIESNEDMADDEE